MSRSNETSMATRTKVIEAFQDFDKWVTYPMVFGMMDDGDITLNEIKNIAQLYAGIGAGTIKSRRRFHRQAVSHAL